MAGRVITVVCAGRRGFQGPLLYATQVYRVVRQMAWPHRTTYRRYLYVMDDFARNERPNKAAVVELAKKIAAERPEELLFVGDVRPGHVCSWQTIRRLAGLEPTAPLHAVRDWAAENLPSEFRDGEGVLHESRQSA